MNLSQRIKKIAPLFGRPFRVREVAEFLPHVSKVQVKKNTISKYIQDFVREGFLKRASFSEGYDTKFVYFVFPKEDKTYLLNTGTKMDLYKNKIDQEGKYGTQYQCFMKVRDLIELASSSKYFFKADPTVVNELYKLFRDIKPDPSFVPFAFVRGIMIHAFTTDVKVDELIDENGVLKGATLSAWKGGTSSAFQVLNGWDAVEILRKTSMLMEFNDMKLDTPIIVSVVITESDDETVEIVRETYLTYLDHLNKGKRDLNQKIIDEIDYDLRLIEINDDERLKKEKETLDSEEEELKLQLKELHKKMRDVKEKKDKLFDGGK